MKKEVLLAIFFGTLFGLTVAFGIWRLNSSIKTAPSGTITESTPTSTPQAAFGLTIVRPSELSVVTSVDAKVSGITKNDSWTVVSSPLSDTIAKSDGDGGFEIEAELAGGVNNVTITSYDVDGKGSQKSLLLVHSSQFEDDTKEATESAKTVNLPISYIGTVTDIFEGTINLKDLNQEIKQVSVEENTSYANEITKKEVKFEDIAIGDFVVGMGFKNGNNVLHARRVVVASPPRDPDYKIYYGEVVEIKNKVLTLKTLSEELTLTFPKNWKGPDIKEIENEMKVIVVTIPDSKNVETVRTVHIAS